MQLLRETQMVPDEKGSSDIDLRLCSENHHSLIHFNTWSQPCNTSNQVTHLPKYGLTRYTTTSEEKKARVMMHRFSKQMYTNS